MTQQTNRITRRKTGALGDPKARKLVRRALAYLLPVPQLLREGLADVLPRGRDDCVYVRMMTDLAVRNCRAARTRLRGLLSQVRGQVETGDIKLYLSTVIDLAYVLGDDGEMEHCYAQRFAEEALAVVECLGPADDGE